MQRSGIQQRFRFRNGQEEEDMRASILGLAAAAATVGLTPAVAAETSGGVTVHRNVGVMTGSNEVAGSRWHGDWRRDRHGDGRDRRGFGEDIAFAGSWGAPEGWALYNTRSWQPDSFNDWWHDRPDRAYPRWFQHNENCDRVWAGGGVWRCGW
jgi:hypothetical protein